MPTRHRNHVLEKISRDELSRALPLNWVCRDKTDDYGVDGEIEIFDENGKPTGNVFLFQLKATDENDLAKALKIPLSLETFDYLNSLELNVMLIRYCNVNKKLYGKWTQSFDPYYFKGEKSATFHFSVEDEMDVNFFEKLDSEITEIRNLKKAFIPETLLFNLEVSDTQNDIKQSAEEISFEFNKFCTANNFKIKISNSSDSNWKIKITPEELVVSLANIRGVVVHIGSDDIQYFDRCLVNDLLLTVSVALLDANSNRGAEIIPQIFNNCSFLARNDMLSKVVFNLCKHKQEETVVALSKFIRIEKKSLDGALFVSLGALKILEAKGIVALKVAEELEAIFETFLKKKDEDSAAIAAYMLSDFYQKSNLKKAFSFLNKLRKLNKKFSESFEFLKRAAGLLFLFKRYSMALHYYEKCYKEKATPEIEKLFADSLLFCGRYEEALELLKKWSNRIFDPSDAEFYLKIKLLDYIVNDLNIKQQVRRPKVSFSMTGKWAAGDTSSVALLLDALNSDSLCGFTWFNLAVYFLSRDKKKAASFYLFAGLCNNWDAEAWSLAFLISAETVVESDNGLEPFLIFFSGYFFCKDYFIEKIIEQAKHPQNKEHKIRIIKLAVELANGIDSFEAKSYSKLKSETAKV